MQCFHKIVIYTFIVIYNFDGPTFNFYMFFTKKTTKIITQRVDFIILL